MSTKREHLVNSLKAVTAADCVAYGLTPDESICVVKLLAALTSSRDGVTLPSGERFSSAVVHTLRNVHKIGAIKQYREETGAMLIVAKEAVERLQAHLGIHYGGVR